MSVSLSAAAFVDRAGSRHLIAPAGAWAAFLGVVLAASVAGVLVTDRQGTAQAIAYAGADWAHLLRAMAVIKVLMAAGLGAAVVWRLGSAVSPAWLAAYCVAGAAMAAGPGLVWGLVHIGLGALLLHAGFAASCLLLWRDPQVGRRLAALVAARRAAR